MTRLRSLWARQEFRVAVALVPAAIAVGVFFAVQGIRAGFYTALPGLPAVTITQPSRSQPWQYRTPSSRSITATTMPLKSIQVSGVTATPTTIRPAASTTPSSRAAQPMSTGIQPATAPFPTITPPPITTLTPSSTKSPPSEQPTTTAETPIP